MTNRVNWVIMGAAALVIFALLDGFAKAADWTESLVGAPPKREFEWNGQKYVVDDATAAALHRDWLAVGSDMRRAIDGAAGSLSGTR